MNFSLRLKELRENAGYSQYTFANKFGVAQSTVGGWEAGKREPNFDIVKRLADFFSVSVDYLIGHSDDKEDSKVGGLVSEQTRAIPAEVLYQYLSPEAKDEIIKLIRSELISYLNDHEIRQ